jgi:hypothetical protein
MRQSKRRERLQAQNPLSESWLLAGGYGTHSPSNSARISTRDAEGARETA